MHGNSKAGKLHIASACNCWSVQDDKAAFAQLTVRVRAAHRFAAYDAAGRPVAGDETREVPVQDVWVFERYLTPGLTSRWRVAGVCVCVCSLIRRMHGPCTSRIKCCAAV